MEPRLGVETLSDSIAVAMHIDVKILVEFDGAFKDTCPFFHCRLQ